MIKKKRNKCNYSFSINMDKKGNKQLFKAKQNANINVSGAISGARNPEGKKAKEHARRYYGLVRSMKNDVIKIAKTTGIEEQEIKEVKDYIFISKHELEGGYN